jgi:hypothetical protein
MTDQGCHIKWITIKQAIELTEKSEITIRRFVAKHKSNANVVSKDDAGRSIINPTILQQTYTFSKEGYQDDSSDTSQDDMSDKKYKKKENNGDYHDERDKYHGDRRGSVDTEKLALMTISKQSNDISKMLLHKPFYKLVSVWITIFFILISLIAGYFAYMYKNELITTQKNEITQINSKYEEIDKTKDQVIKSNEKDLKETKAALKETRTAYTQSLKAIDILHVKYGEKLDTSQQEIADLQFKLAKTQNSDTGKK